MPNYVPIFKGKPAEFTAWEKANAVVRSSATPLFELAPSDKLEAYLKSFVANTSRITVSGEALLVDAFAVDQTTPLSFGGLRIIEWISDQLAAAGTPFRPVVRAGDPAVVLADAAAAQVVHGQGVVVRLGSQALDPDLPGFVSALPGLLATLGVSVAEIHLVLDYQYVSSPKDVSRALPGLTAWLAWLARSPRLASVTVASGAFPATISNLATGADHLLPRHDADLFRSLATPVGLDVGFGDYAVNHPAIGPSIPRGPLPSMRYTAGSSWLVRRESKARPGNESFFTVCENIVRHSAFSGASYSWGDAEIARSATSTGGAGTATQWRAYATSHHLQSVVDRLASLGAP